MRQLFSCGNNCFCGNQHAGVGRRWNMMIKVLLIITIIIVVASSMQEVAGRWSMMMVVTSC